MSKNYNQLDLLTTTSRSKPLGDEVPLTVIRKRQTLIRAINLAQEVSGLEDKQVYGPLDLDASHWSRIKNGTASMPGDERFVHFMDVVNNEIPLIWLAESRGYDWTTIRRHQSTEQKRIADLEQALAESERTNTLLLSALTGKAGKS